MDIVDTDLLARFRDSRDERAFADLVVRHQALVQSACRRVLNDPSAIDDVVQETFWRLAERADEVSTSLSGWLHATATRLAIDWLRRDRRGWRSVGSASALPAFAASTANSPEEVCRQVLDAVDDLPAPERDLIVRHYLLGATLASLSAVTGTPATTIHRRLHQGLSSLRESLRRRGVETPMGCGLLLLIAGSPWPRPGVLPAPVAAESPVPASARAPQRLWWRAAAAAALLIALWAVLALGAGPGGVGGADGVAGSADGIRGRGDLAIADRRTAGAALADARGMAGDADTIGWDAGSLRGHGGRPGVDGGLPLPPIAPDQIGRRSDPVPRSDGGTGSDHRSDAQPADANEGMDLPHQASLAPVAPVAPGHLDRSGPAASRVPGAAASGSRGDQAPAGKPALATIRMAGDGAPEPMSP
jgi:RNA polymerase sigma factor (sigma-70 family)